MVVIKIKMIKLQIQVFVLLYNGVVCNTTKQTGVMQGLDMYTVLTHNHLSTYATDMYELNESMITEFSSTKQIYLNMN